MLLNGLGLRHLPAAFIYTHIQSASHIIIVSVLVKDQENGVMKKINIRHLHRLIIPIPRSFLIEHRGNPVAVHQL